MSDAISFDGVRYVSTIEAAEQAALSSDYVALLSRRGEVRAKRIGRKWYIDPHSLDRFLADQNALKARRSAELSAQLRDVAERTALASGTAPQTPSPDSSGLRPTGVFQWTAAATAALVLVGGLSAAAFALAHRSGIWADATSHNQLASAAAATSPATSAQTPTATSTGHASQPGATSSAQNEFANAATSESNPSVINQYITSPVERIVDSEPLAADNFVTQDELNSQLLQLTNTLTQKFSAPATSPVPQNVAAGGNFNEPYVPIAPPIDNLSNVTITNPTFSGVTTSNVPEGSNLYYTDARVEALLGSSATTTFGNGIALSGGCVSINGTCLATGGGGADNPGGSNTEVQFNDGGVFNGNADFTFDKSGDLLTVTNASTTNFVATNATSTNLFASFANVPAGVINTLSGTTLTYTAASTTNISASGEGYFGTASTTNLVVSNSPSGFLQTNAQGAVTATSSLSAASIFGVFAPSQGGTGTSTLPSYGQLLIGNSIGGYNLVATSSLGITAGSGGTSNVSTSTQNTWSALQVFAGNASSSNFSDFGTAYFGGSATSSFNSAGQLNLANLASALLSVNASGQVVATSTIGWNVVKGPPNSIFAFDQNGNPIATTSIGVNYLTGTLPIANGGTNATSFTSGQLLAYNGTSFVSTSTIGNNQLANAAVTVSAGSGLSGGGIVALGGSTSLSLNLADANSWTGLQTFGHASSTLGSVSTLWLPNQAGTLLKTNANGQVAAAVAGTDYQAPVTASYPISFSGNNLSLAFGTTTANTFSNLQTLNGGASTTNVTASGEGYFATASTTNLIISGIVGSTQCLHVDATGHVTGTGSDCGSSGGGSVNSVSNSDGTLTISPTSGGVVASLNLAHSDAWSALQLFTGNASSTNFSNFATAYFGGTATSSFNSAGQLNLANLASALLSVNASGQVVASSTIGTNLLTGTLGTVNGTSLTAGGSITVTAASSTALSDNNTFSGNDIFNNTVAASINGNANTATTLQTARTINGVSFNGSSNIIVDAASSTLLGDANVFSGVDSFTDASSNFSGTWQTFSPSHFQTAGTYLTGLGNYATTTATSVSLSTSTLSFNGLTLGQTAVASSNNILLTPTVTGTLNNSGLTNSTIVVNGTTLTLGDAADTVTAASSTLLGDNNTFSGNDIFSNLLTLNGGLTAFASSTIGNGTQASGLTINGGATTTGNLLVQGNATTSALFSTTASSTNLFSQLASLGTLDLNGLTSSLLSVNGSGQVVATSTIGNSQLANSSVTINTSGPLAGGVALSLGGSLSLSCPTCTTGGITALGNYATTTATAISISTSTLSWNGLTLGNTFAVSSNGISVTPTISGTLSNSGLTNSSVTVSAGSGLGGGGAVSLGGSTSLSLNTGSSNNWSALQLLSAGASSTAESVFNGAFFGATATSSFNSTGQLTLANLASAVLGVNSSGQVVATSTIGTNLLSANTISGVQLGGTLASLSAGGGLSGSAYNGSGSQTFSLNLGSANNWTGLQTFANASSTLETDSTLWLPNITAGSLLYANGSSQVAAAAATYPIQFSGGVLSLAFGTSTSNTFAGTQTFSNLTSTGLAQFTNSSSTLASVFGSLWVGGTATTTITGTATSTFGAGISATYLNLTGSSATSTAANGLNLSAGCFAINGTCVGGGGGGTPGGSNGQIEFDNGGAFGGIANSFFNSSLGAMTYGTSTAQYGLLTLGTSTAPQLLLSDNTPGDNMWSLRSIGNSLYIATSTATATSSSAALTIDKNGNVTLATALSLANGGTGATSASAARSNLGLGSVATLNQGSSGTNSASAGNSAGCSGGSDGGDFGFSGSLTFSGGLVTGSSNYTFTAYTGCDGDIAERYGTVGQMPERGDIVMLVGTTTSRDFLVSNPAPGESTSTPYTITTADVAIADYADRNLLIGAVPTAPNVIGLDVIASSSNPQLVALVGHVPVNMTLDGGAVAIGDPITVSTSTPGAGMKATTSGTILGYALAPFTGPGSGEGGSNMIEVYIAPQQWIAPSDFGALLALSQYGAATSSAPAAGSFMDTFIQNLLAQITQWLASATNGIDQFFAQVGNFQTVNSQTSNASTTNTNQLCITKSDGTPVCVTGDQLAALLDQTASAQTPESVSSSASNGSESSFQNSSSTSPISVSSTTPPIIQINGDNPAIVQVGDSYNDLGATITAPQADLNLGIQLYLNGQSVPSVQLDTTQAATDTIDYVATDQSGLTSTSTRTVIIEPTQASQPANDNQASSTPANDNSQPLDATGTAATSSSR